MKYYAGLDVSVKETSVCIVNEAGKVCREVKVISHPEALVRALQDPAWRFTRIGLEAGTTRSWSGRNFIGDFFLGPAHRAATPPVYAFWHSHDRSAKKYLSLRKNIQKHDSCVIVIKILIEFLDGRKLIFDLQILTCSRTPIYY